MDTRERRALAMRRKLLYAAAQGGEREKRYLMFHGYGQAGRVTRASDGSVGFVGVLIVFSSIIPPCVFVVD